MKLLDQLSQTILLRQLNRIGKSIDQRLETQNRLLTRLVNHLAGPEVEQEPVDQAIRSVDYSEDRTQGEILSYIEDTIRKIGREPTEDEIVDFLDGKPAGRS